MYQRPAWGYDLRSIPRIEPQAGATLTVTDSQPGGVLSGIKVLSFAQLAQGPAAVQMLADLGADVIKVERPAAGAWERSWAGGDAYLNGESLFFLGFNRNQRSLTLDLKTPEGQEIAHKLAGWADVVVENFRPGVMDRLGLGYDALTAINPGIVYCSGSGFGPDGPYRDRAGQDLILQAESGLASVTGRAGDPPTPVGAPVVDIHAGALLAFGIVSALLGRERTGRGARVESSLLEAALHLQMENLTYHLNGHFLRPDRCEEGTPTRFHGAPYGIYATRDGHVALSMNPLPKLAALLELPALEAFTPQDSVANPAPIKRMIAAVMTSRTTAEWIETFAAADVWCGAVNTYEDLETHPQVAAIEAFQTVTHPVAGELTLLRHPVRFDGDQRRPITAPPLLGADTNDILGDLGYNPRTIARLRARKVI